MCGSVSVSVNQCFHVYISEHSIDANRVHLLSCLMRRPRQAGFNFGKKASHLQD